MPARSQKAAHASRVRALSNAHRATRQQTPLPGNYCRDPGCDVRGVTKTPKPPPQLKASGRGRCPGARWNTRRLPRLSTAPRRGPLSPERRCCLRSRLQPRLTAKASVVSFLKDLHPAGCRDPCPAHGAGAGRSPAPQHAAGGGEGHRHCIAQHPPSELWERRPAGHWAFRGSAVGIITTLHLFFNRTLHFKLLFFQEIIKISILF